MRIIAGQRRGHRIEGPKATACTRPTSDLVREALFNIVGDLVVGRPVVDLFAGTGALGLEALSRGAARALFIEKNRENVALIHRNIATLRYQDRCQVRLTDAYRWVRGLKPMEGPPMAVFLDPPYRDDLERRHQVLELLTLLVEKLPPGSLIALEASRGLDPSLLPDPDSWDVRRYGNTRLAIRISPEAAPAVPSSKEPGSRHEDGEHEESSDVV
jgi:16S rRNA (guanine966-N2)-methyltransferase